MFSSHQEQYEHMYLKCLVADAFNNLQDSPFTTKQWNMEGEYEENFEKTYMSYNKIM